MAGELNRARDELIGRAPTKQPKCILTGCDLFVPDEAKTLHGDLHRVGDTFIFNGVLNGAGESAWRYKYNDPERTTARTVVLDTGTVYFERRGVVVFGCGVVTFNQPAQDDLLRMPK